MISIIKAEKINLLLTDYMFENIKLQRILNKNNEKIDQYVKYNFIMLPAVKKKVNQLITTSCT